MKYLLWQFSAYAAVALALGIVVGRWSLSTRVVRAERDRERAAYELSTLTVKASALLEESGRERSSVVDANGRLADDLRRARDAQARIEADLQAADRLRAQAEQALQAARDRVTATGPSTPDNPGHDAELARIAGELAAARAELARRDAELAAALAGAEARVSAAEGAYRELSRTHAALVRSAQAELTRALLRAERAERAERATSPGWALVDRIDPPKTTDTIVDLRPYDRVDQLQERPVD